jgi:hypothetical protein
VCNILHCLFDSIVTKSNVSIIEFFVDIARQGEEPPVRSLVAGVDSVGSTLPRVGLVLRPRRGWVPVGQVGGSHLS